jgi:hypothetical protein
MSNRHDRRKASATRKKSKLRGSTLDQHFERTLRRLRAEFGRAGEIHPRFECVADAETFEVPANWPGNAKGVACSVLRDSFRRRGVKRYLFAGECWVRKTPGLRPADDPDRSETIQVIAVEHDGLRKYAFAEITRNEGTATLGPWQANTDVPQSWLMELLEEGHSDRALSAEQPPVGKLDFQNLWQHPEQAAQLRDSFEIHTQLADLIENQFNKGANGASMAIFMAVESVLRGVVKEMGSLSGLGQFARFLKDYPDKFPMFPTVSSQVPSKQLVESIKDTLRRFSGEKRQEGLTPSAIFEAFINMYMRVGSQAIGALMLADRVENWDPEQQAKLEQVGLRSSFDLDDEEGRVFVALSAERYPCGVMGRRNAVGDLFVSRMFTCSLPDFATAVDDIKQSGFELIVGSEAKDLICKMEQVQRARSASF